MYAFNGAPKSPTTTTGAPLDPSKPTIVKVHAQWCPVCMLGKSAWKQLERDYATRANLVVFDATNQKTIETSRAEAQRLGLAELFDAHSSEVGAVLLLRPGSKEASDTVPGLSKLSAYKVAIDAVLERAPKVN